MQRGALAKRCFAEPGPYQTPALVTAPALQRTAPRRATRCAASGARTCTCLPQRLQPGFDFGAARLEERRQRELFAKRLHRFVGGETRAVGGDLEQDAVRLAKIQAAEIEPVDGAAVADAEFVEPLQPSVVLRVIRRAEGDVMHAAGSLQGYG